MVWLALGGLPVQGFAAATMAYCKHGSADTASQEVASHGHHGDPQSGHGKSAETTPPCADCSPCHLCGAFALPAANPVLLQDAASVYRTRLTLQPDGHFPDQPKRPPLA